MTERFDELMGLVDPIIDKYLGAGSESLNEHELVMVCVWMLEAEVNNGGFNQFFWNSAGDISIETVASLHKIGASKTASIVEAANANFGEMGPPKDREVRQQELEALEESGVLKLDSLDSDFYKYPNDLEELMYAYAKNNNLL
ncbi:DMP19 family protein [Microbulbifer sp. ANSA001]|uniref:DMP19 family protein n=1 Tax=Microbulbifer sp. ANSA001 TaxID=3243358 RepID=UPI0040419DCC